MTILQRVRKDKRLLQVFKRYNKRYLSVGKRPNNKKILPDDLYSTMRLEGEKITKKTVRALFR